MFHWQPVHLLHVMLDGVQLPPPPIERRNSVQCMESKYFCPICMYYYDRILARYCLHYLDHNRRSEDEMLQSIHLQTLYAVIRTRKSRTSANNT